MPAQTAYTQLKALHAETSQVSYLPGENFILRVQLDAPISCISDITNVSIDLHRVDAQRNQCVFGFGTTPDIVGMHLVVTQKLPAGISPGLHLVAGASLCWGEDGARIQKISFDPIFFLIREPDALPAAPPDVAAAVENMQNARRAYAHKTIVTPAASKTAATAPTAYRVLIFGIGCLLDAPQQLEGFTLTPLGRGLSYASLHDIVNQRLDAYQLHIPFDPQLNGQYEHATPTFVLEYWRVIAADASDALQHCRTHANLVFDLLGLARGQTPQAFCCLAIDHASAQIAHYFSVPWYRGNLLSAFNPATTANLIEHATPRLQHDPFLRMLVRAYAQATADEDENVTLLRCWSVLELLADRAIKEGQPSFHLDGQPILHRNGKQANTGSKSARVYELTRQSGIGYPSISYGYRLADGAETRLLMGGDETHPGYTPGTRIIPLWDFIRAAYAIRNCIAHEGYYSADTVDRSNPDETLAADLINNTALDPRKWVRDQALLFVQRELASAQPPSTSS